MNIQTNGIETGGHHKVVLGSSLRWTLVKKFYVEDAVYFYCFIAKNFLD